MTPDGNHRILVIDDNRAIHDDFRKILVGESVPTGLEEMELALFGDEPTTGARQYTLDSAYQGQEGFEMAARAARAGEPYALAFIDMRMPPGWDGAQTIEKIWEVDHEIQIVICSAYSDYSWSEVQKKFGATDRLLILKKPFDTAEVSQLACALTEKWQMARRAEALLTTNISVTNDRDDKLALIERQRSAMTRMGTPILQIWDGILTVPVIGVVDSRRAEEIRESLLLAITRTQSQHAIIDLTGVDALDIATVDYFLRIIESVQLLGAQCVVSGILPSVAQTMVELGVDLSRVTTRSDLQEALKSCLRAMGYSVDGGHTLDRKRSTSR